MDEKTKQAYITWLSSITWDWFWTGTFREKKMPDGTIRGRYSVNGARRAAERFYRGFPTLKIACLFIEPGSLYGKIHLHGLLRFRTGEEPPASAISSRWYGSYGYNRLEPPRSLESVSGYCSKYLTKHAKDETYIILT